MNDRGHSRALSQVVHIAGAGTFVGALCFLAAMVIARPGATTRVREGAHAHVARSRGGR